MMSHAHTAFLEMLGWEGKELDRFLPEWLNAAEFLGLTEADVEFAVNEWLPVYWDLSLAGIRKFIAACIREVVGISKVRQYREAGDAVLYINIPSAPVCIYANKLAGNGRLHIAYPSYMMVMVLGAFFNKSNGCYGGVLNPACAHCAMNMMRANAAAKGILSPPTITWNWGIKCSEAPKTDELLSCLQGDLWKDAFITLPHDAPLGTMEANDEKRVSYLAAKLRAAQQEISDETGIVVTEAHMRTAMDEYMAYMDRVETLTDLVMTANPQPITGNELTIFGICSDLCFDVGYDYINDALDTIIREVRERIARGQGVLPKGSPKVACQFNPIYAPWVDKAFRDNGVCLAQGRMFPFASSFRQYLKESNLYASVARMSLATPSSMNMLDEARININLLKRYPVDGALYGFYSFDRWVGALQKTMIRLIEHETGIPHFYLEGDLWDSMKSSPEDRMAIIRSICNCLKISNIDW